MAPLPVITDTIRCVVNGYTPAGTPWYNILHFEKPSGTSYAAAIALANTDLHNFYSQAGWGGTDYGFLRYVDSNFSVSGARFTPLDGVTASTVNTWGDVGFTTDTGLPPDTCMVVSWRTNKRGPRYRGRTYLAGFGEGANVSEGRIDPTTRNGVLAAATKLLTEMSAQSTSVVIASYKYATKEAVSSASIDFIWDRQKRRR